MRRWLSRLMIRIRRWLSRLMVRIRRWLSMLMIRIRGLLSMFMIRIRGWVRLWSELLIGLINWDGFLLMNQRWFHDMFIRFLELHFINGLIR